MSIHISGTARWRSYDGDAAVRIIYLNRDEEGRNVYQYRIMLDETVIHEARDLRSGVNDPVNVGEMLVTLSRFMDAWSEALNSPASENADIFPQTEAMIAWSDQYGEDFSMDCIELDETERAGQ